MTTEKIKKATAAENLILDKQIEIIERILAQKANPSARAISTAKIEAELAKLQEKKRGA